MDEINESPAFRVVGHPAPSMRDADLDRIPSGGNLTVVDDRSGQYITVCAAPDEIRAALTGIDIDDPDVKLIIKGQIVFNNCLPSALLAHSIIRVGGGERR